MSSVGLSPPFLLAPLQESGVSDAELERLLRFVYVDGGFTDPALAGALFAAGNVRARGEVIAAVDAGGVLAGCVVVVSHRSPACRFAQQGEAELHLLAVHPDARGRGIGAQLVAAAMQAARSAGASKMILWTQPAMTAAQRLYARHGFVRAPEMDFARGPQQFLVLTCAL